MTAAMFSAVSATVSSPMPTTMLCAVSATMITHILKIKSNFSLQQLIN
jgi:hypothetical protein